MNRITGLRTHALAVLVLTVSSGCSPRDAPAPAVSVRDSAGVTIYENSGGEWTEATAWRLSSEPILTIGALNGPEEYLLFEARGARRLSNGNIVIANGGTNELRFYDRNGMHVRSVGREGDGPGEFRLLGEPWPLGSDSLVISDFLNARFTVFDINGEFGRSFRLDPIPDARRPLPIGVLADNSLLGYATIRSGGQRPPGLRRDSILYARHSLEGAHMGTFIRREDSERIVTPLEGNIIRIMMVPYGRDPTATVSGNRWYYGSGESWEIEVYSPDGALTHLFRRDEPNRPVTKEMEDAFREPDSGSGNDVPASVSRARASMPIPETMPAYESFLVSDNGDLWVENYTYVLSSEQPSWAVFRDDGEYLGEVDTPIGARVTHIGDDFVLVIWEDELGVEQVQMYELIKP